MKLLNSYRRFKMVYCLHFQDKVEGEIIPLQAWRGP